MSEKKITVYAVSDATGELAVSLANSALRQFDSQNIILLRRARIRTPEKLARVVNEAKENKGFIIFTFVSPEMRASMSKLAIEIGVPVVDVMGPVMSHLSQYIEKSPSDQPGLRYRFTLEYLKRNEAIEFSVKHDDGLGLDTLHQADLVLLGISRTSKTPLSVYLAYRGYKTANVPIIRDVPLPEELYGVDPKKIIGLTIDPEKLVELRGVRLARMGRSRMEEYAQIDAIRQEMAYAQRLFVKMGPCPVIDVTLKAVEEVATEILSVLGR